MSKSKPKRPITGLSIVELRRIEVAADVAPNTLRGYLIGNLNTMRHQRTRIEAALRELGLSRLIRNTAPESHTAEAR